MVFGNTNRMLFVIFVHFFCDVGSTRRTSSFHDISDSDLFLNSAQLILKYGYNAKNYTIVTKDGYNVQLCRIPKFGPPVLLVHGIGDSSDSWLALGPSDSIAFLLSDLNYDVWMYNARGNKYSRGHIRNLSQKQYWNFSYEEMGSQDLPAVVDFVLSETSYLKLTYVGFSQGTTIFFVMCSLKPEYNMKIKSAFLLAPITTIKNINHPYIDFFVKNEKVLSKFLDDIGVYDLFSDNLLLNLYHANVCRNTSLKILCEIEFFINYGIRNLTNLMPRRLPSIASHIPAGITTKTFVHYFQSYTTGRFARFDYGSVGNQVLYASQLPPKFNLSLVRAPVSVFVSASDSYSKVYNVEKIMQELPNVVKYVLLNKSLDFTHLEFIYGSRVRSFVNIPVIDAIIHST